MLHLPGMALSNVKKGHPTHVPANHGEAAPVDRVGLAIAGGILLVACALIGGVVFALMR